MESKSLASKSPLPMKPYDSLSAPGESPRRHSLRKLAQEPLLIVLLVWAIAFATAWICLVYFD
ncbi:MAG: hypothetical protein SF339_12575 [Blastocatellia bacterium]|nr:hypothetical protein [Blastocatellia bacterium]